MAKDLMNVAITVSVDQAGDIEFQANNGKYVYLDEDSGILSWHGDTDFDNTNEIMTDTQKHFKSQEKALRWLVKGIKKSKNRE